MNKEHYLIFFHKDKLTYEFWSEGPKGKIKKVVRFVSCGNSYYSLGFGDWDESKRKIDDLARSNNSDRDKVLATVALCVLEFLSYKPYARVIARGSTPARTRLYQIGILTIWREINEMLRVEGYRNNGWQLFERNQQYDAFMVRTKKTM